MTLSFFFGKMQVVCCKIAGSFGAGARVWVTAESPRHEEGPQLKGVNAGTVALPLLAGQPWQSR